MKQPFPFEPFEDSLLGKILMEIAGEEGKGDLLRKSLYSHIPENSGFYFTPKADKQNIMNLFPVKARNWIQEQKISPLSEEMISIIRGNKTNPPRMDVALELAEWMITGFDDDSLSKELLKILTNSRMDWSSEQISQIKLSYQKYLQEEEDELRKREDSDIESDDDND